LDLDSRLRGNDTPLVILNRKPPCHPALDAGSRQNDWIPVFTGMTERVRE